MNALVIGGSGLAGRHTITSLTDSAATVFATAYTTPPAELPHVESIETRTCDIRNREDVEETIQWADPDVVYHYGAFVSVSASHSSPAETLETNAIGTINLFETLSTHAPDASIIVPGSAEEYGPVGPDNLPIDESTPLRPDNPYGISKVSQEQFARYYSRRFDIPVYLPRTFHYAGPGQPTSFVCADFASQIVAIERGQQSEIAVGNLAAKRDFLDIRDVVRAYEQIVAHGKSGTVYNVCRGEAVAIETLLDTLVELSTAEIDVVVDEDKYRPLDVPEFVGDNSQLQADTNWKPEISLETMLSDTLEHFREQC